MYRQLQQRLQDSLSHDSEDNWTTVVSKAGSQHNNPSTFLREVRNLNGAGNRSPYYILSPENEKLLQTRKKNHNTDITM